MSKPLEQLVTDQHEAIGEALCCEPLPYPGTQGYEVTEVGHYDAVQELIAAGDGVFLGYLLDEPEVTGKYVDEVIQADDWMPACGGTEKEFIVDGTRWLYMWNRTTGQHAYYNVTDDVFELDVNFHPCCHV